MSCDAQVMERAREAVGRLHMNVWADWMTIGEAYTVLQTQAMRLAETNKPEGRRYCTTMSTLLKDEGFDAVDSGARSRLIEVMKNRRAIEEWRSKLPFEKRLKWNHPQAVLREWKKATMPPIEKEPKAEKPKLELMPGSPEEIGQQLEAFGFNADQVRALLTHAPKLRETIQQCIRSIWERQQRTKKKNAKKARKAKRATKPPIAGNHVDTDESKVAMTAKFAAMAETPEQVAT
jgi:hypothetical protein